MQFDYTGVQQKTILQYLALDEPARVLDVGCGNGRLVDDLARHVPFAAGVDPDNALIQKAKAQFQKTNSVYLAGSADALCFSDASFDTIVLCESLHHVPADRQKQALHECRRILKPAGRLLILEPVHGSGASGRILKIFNHEETARQSAIRAIESVIDNGFNLDLKNRIRSVFTCKGFEDLYAYCKSAEPNLTWENHFKKKIKNRLARCEKNASEEILIDYKETVWLLIKS